VDDIEVTIEAILFSLEPLVRITDTVQVRAARGYCRCLPVGKLPANFCYKLNGTDSGATRKLPIHS
jgi:hypothetical protein